MIRHQVGPRLFWQTPAEPEVGAELKDGAGVRHCILTVEAYLGGFLFTTRTLP